MLLKILCGIGNYDKLYNNTRHNAGFILADLLTEGATYNQQKSFEYTKIEIDNKEFIVCKTKSYMNISGIPVSAIMQYFKAKPEDLIIIHDELDFEFGRMQFKTGGGHAGHNGLRSIIDSIGNKFHKIRFGIGRPENENFEISDWVLSKFTANELKKVEQSKQEMLDILHNLNL